MNILVIGGTKFFGKYTVQALLNAGHKVTIATRGKTKDLWGDEVTRIVFNRIDAESVKETLAGKHYDVVIDKLAYCSNDVKCMLDVIDCERYIYMSTTAVYDPKHWDTKEEDFDPLSKELVWCERKDFPYDEIKRQAECAVSQCYPKQKSTAVRYPFVIGEDDYTKRIAFYVEHVCLERPMFIDNADCQMSFIRSDEAGKFMAYLAGVECKECAEDICAVNGASAGTISIREMLTYVEEKTGKKAVLSEDGEAAPYNGEVEYSINTEKAESMGFQFSDLKDWIYGLLDQYIEIYMC